MIPWLRPCTPDSGLTRNPGGQTAWHQGLERQAVHILIPSCYPGTSEKVAKDPGHQIPDLRYDLMPLPSRG